jgi:hypothetical protein
MPCGLPIDIGCVATPDRFAVLPKSESRWVGLEPAHRGNSEGELGLSLANAATIGFPVEVVAVPDRVATRVGESGMRMFCASCPTASVTRVASAGFSLPGKNVSP